MTDGPTDLPPLPEAQLPTPRPGSDRPAIAAVTVVGWYVASGALLALVALVGPSSTSDECGYVGCNLSPAGQIALLAIAGSRTLLCGVGIGVVLAAVTAARTRVAPGLIGTVAAGLGLAFSGLLIAHGAR